MRIRLVIVNINKRELAMKYLIGALFGLMPLALFAQAIYGPQGQYQGYSQTSPSGVTNVYNASGQNVQSFQTDNGQTNFYSPQGQYQGTTTAPLTPAPNTTINTPRQAPQAPTVKGW
jgi:hypothetical protein